MSTKESKADRIERLFERKVVIDELELDDIDFIVQHGLKAYVSAARGGKKAKKENAKSNPYFDFTALVRTKIAELDLPTHPNWVLSFSSYLWKKFNQDTDKLENNKEFVRLHQRYQDEYKPIPEVKEKKAKAKKVSTYEDSEEEEEEEDEAPKPKPKPAAKAAPKKEVVVDSEDDDAELHPGSAKRTDEAPKAKAKAAPKAKAKEEEEAPKAKAKTAPKKEVKAEEEEEAPKAKEAPKSKETPKPKEEPKPTPKAKAPAVARSETASQGRAATVRMTPEEGGEVQTIKGKEYYTAQVDGKLNVWTVKEVEIKGEDGEVEEVIRQGGEHVGIYNFKTKEIDTDEVKEEEEEDEE